MAEQASISISKTIYQRIRELANMHKHCVANVLVLVKVLEQLLPPQIRNICR